MPAVTTPFQTILGSAFDILPAPLRHLHGLEHAIKTARIHPHGQHSTCLVFRNDGRHIVGDIRVHAHGVEFDGIVVH